MEISTLPWDLDMRFKHKLYLPSLFMPESEFYFKRRYYSLTEILYFF